MPPPRKKQLRAPFVIAIAIVGAHGCTSEPRVPPERPIVELAAAPSPPSPPPVSSDDADKDGVVGSADLCPSDAEDKDSFQDEDGCPDPDNDKDGILDAVDKCPQEPEVYNGVQDDDGCPEAKVIIATSNPPALLDQIRFEPGTATLAKESMPVMHAIASVLRDNPQILLLQVDGHTDEHGALDANVKLSLARAKAVIAVVVTDGIDPARLRPMGYGSYCPVDPAHTLEAWKVNRRVELKLMRTTDGPTNVVSGCPEATAHGLSSPPP